MSVRTDAARIFLTAWLVYAAFWNPWLQSSMTFNFLDAAVSFVDTGRWGMAHPQLYEGKDTAMANGRLVSAEPPGMALLVIPMYSVWRVMMGPVDSVQTFQAFNGFLSLTLGATASALIAVEVASLASWLGGSRRGQLWAALLVAFGTQAFFFGTTVFKENFAALAVIFSFRLSVAPGSHAHRVKAGMAAGLAVALAYPTALLVPLLVVHLLRREGFGSAAAFLLGCVPCALALAVYNWWLFGKPWLTGYYFIAGLSNLGFVFPKGAILLDLLAGPRGGLFLYAPFLLFALAGLAVAWRTGKSGEAMVAVVFLAGLWLAAAGWQSQFADRASWAHSLGPRMMFPAIPLLAAFAAPVMDRMSRNLLLVAGIPSVLCGYLSAQAGVIPTANPFPYAVKTWLSGTGMGVVFKEALPQWLGVDTLHTVVSRPDVSASDLLRLLPTAEGARLAGNQFLLFGANLLVFSGIAWFLRKLWRGSKEGEQRVRQ